MNMNEQVIRHTVEEKLEFVKRCGLKLTHVEPGHVKCLMPAEGNQNHLGTMYAGALFTLAEIPGGALWLSCFDISKSYPILKSFNIDFLKPAKGDIQFEIEIDDALIESLTRECSDKGKAEFTLIGDLTDQEGVVVAKSTGIYQLRKI